MNEKTTSKSESGFSKKVVVVILWFKSILDQSWHWLLSGIRQRWRLLHNQHTHPHVSRILRMHRVFHS